MVCELVGEQPLFQEEERWSLYFEKLFRAAHPEVVVVSELVSVGLVLKSLERTGMSAERVALVS